MSKERTPSKQLNFLLPIPNPKEAQIREKKLAKERAAESRARLIDDLRRVGL